MNRHVPAFLLTCSAALTALATSSDAQASCGSNPCLSETAASTATAYSANSSAGYGVNAMDTSNGTAVYGYSSSGVGVWGTTPNGASAYGIKATNTGTGGYGLFASATSGWGVYGTDFGSGPGVFGTSASGNGVKGTITGGSGAGVYGDGSSHGNGVYGASSSTDAIKGVSTSGTNAGVSGVNNSNNGSAIGVYGAASTGSAGYFSGSVLITGNLQINGSCSGCSDLRLKKNVKPLNGAIDELLQLHGVTFEWADPTKHQHERQTGTQNGFIAQDVEKVFPEWVNDKGYTSKDGETFRTIDLKQIEALEVESIRELKVENDALKVRIQALEDARRPRISFNPNWGIFAAGFVVAGAVLVNGRRKREENRS